MYVRKYVQKFNYYKFLLFFKKRKWKYIFLMFQISLKLPSCTSGAAFLRWQKRPFLSIVLLLKYLKEFGLGGGKECVCFGWTLLAHALQCKCRLSARPIHTRVVSVLEFLLRELFFSNPLYCSNKPYFQLLIHNRYLRKFKGM